MAGETKHPFPVMEQMTVKMVREYLVRKQSIIVPLGGIEQHGYHLPLRTDAVIAERLAWQIGARADILVAPTIVTTFSGGGLPGTINISPAVMSLVVSDTLLSLTSQGFRNIYLLLGHGGSENLRALQDALKMLLRTNPAFERTMIALLPIWRFGKKDSGWRKAFREKDWHAGWLETSLMLALAPELVRVDDLELDCPGLLELQREHPDNYQRAEKIVDDEFVVPRIRQRPEIEVGVMGEPAKASRELGLGTAADIVDSVTAKITALEAQADGLYKEVAFAPEPIIVTAD